MSALPKCGNYQLSISATKLKMLVVNHRHTNGVICDQMLDQLSRIPLYFNLRVKAKPKCSEPSGFLVIRHPSTTRLPLSLLQ